MAGLEPLKRLIYHEKQQDGSMLCAQHALNALLQGNYFTAADLSSLATKVDDLETNINTDRNTTKSSNMDDTGFFSVQVVNEALQVWGLRMAHWRSSEMTEYQSTPYTQFAFILNLEQHWFTLRRFGLAEVVEQATPEEAEHVHWFNLNSFLRDPEWIGRIYLNMMLTQAEEEGYSVYAIKRIDPEAPFPLETCSADEVASTLPQPTHSSSLPAGTGNPPTLSTDRTPHMGSSGGFHSSAEKSTSPHERSNAMEVDPLAGMDEEDMHLQAALQASITGEDVDMPAQYRVPPPAPRFRPAEDQPHGEEEERPTDPEDPIASSLARSKAIMERMFREQEAALRQTYDEEVRGIEGVNRFGAFGQGLGSGSGSGVGVGSGEERRRVLRSGSGQEGFTFGSGSAQTQAQTPTPTTQTRHSTRKRTRGSEEEDEELRRAIEASKVGLSPQDIVSEGSEGSNGSGDLNDSDQGEEGEEREREVFRHPNIVTWGTRQPRTTTQGRGRGRGQGGDVSVSVSADVGAGVGVGVDPGAGTGPDFESNFGEPQEGSRAAQVQAAQDRQRFADHTGVYDDDDAALQAALRASLEDSGPWGGVTIPADEGGGGGGGVDRRVRGEGMKGEERSRTMNKALARPNLNLNDEEDSDDDDDEFVDAEEKVDKGKGKGKEKEEEIEQAPEPVNVDEMRRRRLARFGGGG